MPLHFSEISRSHFDTLSTLRTVFFFPVGPLEDHGPHLPMGFDLDEARWMCRQAASRLEKEMNGWVGVIMPDAPLGIQSNTTDVAINVRGHVLRDWLVDACRSLNRKGFTQFVCLSGNLGPRQLTAIEEAGKILAWRGILGFILRKDRVNLVSASSVLADTKAVKLSPLWPDPLEHGGKRDTSVALAIQCRVDPNYLSLPARELPASTYFSRAILRNQNKTLGYWGEPSKAESDIGNKVLKEALDLIFPKLRAVWEGANPNLIFRSWYSIIPINRSFFKAWLLSICIFGLLVAWLWLSFEVV